jgi:hypothetical protein
MRNEQWKKKTRLRLWRNLLAIFHAEDAKEQSTQREEKGRDNHGGEEKIFYFSSYEVPDTNFGCQSPPHLL